MAPTPVPIPTGATKQAVDRTRYVAHVKASVRTGGALIVATFGVDGPETCSGLPIQRYSSLALANELGETFLLEETMPVPHQTPAGRHQPFIYCRFRVR